jgi:hypothetical protein
MSFQQPLVFNPFRDLAHQFVVIDSIEQFLQFKIDAPAVTFGDILMRLGYCVHRQRASRECEVPHNSEGGT